MKRRSFLKNSSAASLPLFLNGAAVQNMAHRSLFDFINMDDDKVLVLIELNGGNDGLNTVIPMDQYTNLMAARQNVIVPENDVISLTNTLSLHPGFSEMKGLFDNAKLSIVQGVGYPNQNRSHFRSRDIWQSASDANVIDTSGWLGRYFDMDHQSYPENYPNIDFPDPIALTIGNLVSETCQGLGSNFSLAIQDPENLTALALTAEGDIPDSTYGSELRFLINAIKQTNQYGEVITNANDMGNNLSTLYPAADANPLAEKLKTVAKLISGGLRTKIYVVSIGGWDTHGDQVVGGDTTTGKHAELLQQVSQGITAFQDDIEKLGLSERVMGMTFSEFGRRIRSNGSLGTDHGSAAPMFVFGNCVNAGVVGENAQISANVDNQEGVAMQYDFRSVYGSILMDWFDVEESAVKSILTPDFQYIPMVTGCQTTPIDNPTTPNLSFTLAPNPLQFAGELSFELAESLDLRISVFDVRGSELAILSNRSFIAGEHKMTIEAHDYSVGNYYLRIQGGSWVKSIPFIKV